MSDRLLGTWIDRLSGGPERRQREVLRHLDDLDRLDAEATPSEDVLWPGDGSPVEDPHGWQPPTQSHTPSRSWCSRHGLVGHVAVIVVLGTSLLLPRIPMWVGGLTGEDGALIAGDSAVAAGKSAFADGEAPLPTGPPTDGRVRAAVGLPDRPDTSHYAFMQTNSDGSPVTFDPCRTIHYVVRDAPGVGSAGQGALTRAVADISLATGLAFVFDGYTDEAPADDRGLTRSRFSTQYAPLLIAWSNPSETPALEGRIVGLGGARAVEHRNGDLTYVTGVVRLDAPALVRDIGTPRGARAAQTVITHELAHVVGAGHAQSPDELMAATNTGRDTFGAGDRFVLAMLGRGRCSLGL